jgi:hypothetical protein
VSTAFPHPRLPGTSEGLASDIDGWLSSDALRALLDSFGGPTARICDGPGRLPERCEALLHFTETVNTRTEDQERNAAGELAMTAGQAETVMAAMDALGLRNLSKPAHRAYDHVLMLGGLVRACFNRPAYAAQLLREGTVTSRQVTALGADRDFVEVADPLNDEATIAARVGHPELTTEYQALDLGTRLAFGLGEPDKVEGETSPDRQQLPGLTWGVRHYTGADGLSVRVAAAPSSVPARRAHTGETYEFFADRMSTLAPGMRLLLVTSPIYVPLQHFTAVRLLALPHGVHVETVGGDPGQLPEALRQEFTPTRYLNELRTSARALTALAVSAAGHDGNRA